MSKSRGKKGPEEQKRTLTEEELRKLAHERVWGSADDGPMFVKLESVLPGAAKPKVREADTGEPDEKVAWATKIGGVKQKDIPERMIDEATDLLATLEGDAAVEQAKAAAKRNRRAAKE
jgi:hypothetical protein